MRFKMLNFINRYKNIIFSCAGIGDFFVFDSLLSDYEKKNLKNFYTLEINPSKKCFKIQELILASKKYNPNLNFLIANSNMPNHKKNKDYYRKIHGKNWRNHVLKEYENFPNTICSYTCHNGLEWEKLPSDPYEINSSFTNKKIADISKFCLPENYLSLVPYTSSRENYFSKKDWENILRILKKLNLKGIVLGENHHFIPKSDYIINLGGKTNIVESCALINNSNYFIGVDSCMSVLASFVIETDNFFVKCNFDQSNSIKFYKYYYPFIYEKRIDTRVIYKKFFPKENYFHKLI